MKKIHLLLITLGCLACFATSCKTSSTVFTVYGNPGTEILTPQKTKLATVDNSGKAIVSNPDNDYYAFLLTHQPGSSDYVPFALDYKGKSHNGAFFCSYFGLTLTTYGGVAMLLGAILSEDEVGLATLGIGAGLLGIGMAIGLPAAAKIGQMTHQHHYNYLPTQNTNQDIMLTKPKLESAPAKTSQPDKKTDASQSSKSSKTLGSSQSGKTLKDNATKISGTYVGTGTLKQGNEVIDSYTGIKVTIKKQSKDTVLVNVIESDGSKFFNSDGEYSITKDSNGKYSLTLKGINSATIEIDTNNNLVYLHPRVNIDDDIYSLSIKAKKE